MPALYRYLARTLRRRYARVRLMPYLSGELPAAQRRRVAACIDQDPQLRAEYARLRSDQQTLQADLPPYAPPYAPPNPPPQLESLWARIAAEVNGPPSAPQPAPSLPSRVRYGVVGMLTALALALPLTLGSPPLDARAQVAAQPAPRVINAVDANALSVTDAPTPRGTPISLLSLTQPETDAAISIERALSGSTPLPTGTLSVTPTPGARTP